MYSQHATSATQDALDALMRKYPPRPQPITSTEAMTDPLPDSNAVQDTTLPDAPTTTAPAERDGWKTVEGKAAETKRKNETADKKRVMETSNKLSTTKTGRWGKNSHQPRTTNTSAKKTWAEVIKSGGINVQIVNQHHTATATPPPPFARTSTETIDLSIGFGFAALIYVSLKISREFYIDFVDIRREIRVFTRFGSPHHAKCHQNLANSAPHGPNSLGMRSKPLWTFLKIDLPLLLMEEMEKLIKVMDSVPETCSSARLLQLQKHHHHPPDTPPTTATHYRGYYPCHMATATPPPAFATTSTETIDF
jgi:hypothetical protein